MKVVYEKPNITTYELDNFIQFKEKEPTPNEKLNKNLLVIYAIYQALKQDKQLKLEKNNNIQ